jgi:OOP family OmpA-OmpF porin
MLLCVILFVYIIKKSIFALYKLKKQIKMKKLKLALLVLFATAFIGNVSAQDSSRQWAVSVGLNIVDVRGGDDFSSRFNDYLKNDDWNWSNHPLTRISAEKYLNESFTLQIAGSMNKLDNGFDDVQHTSFDANVKYSLDAVIAKIFGKSTKLFSPFAYLGAGYTSLDGEGEAMLNYGFGVNFWATDGVGFVYQAGTKEQLSDVVPSHYYHSIGILFKL